MGGVLRDYPHGDQNSSFGASLSIGWFMNKAITEHVHGGFAICL